MAKADLNKETFYCEKCGRTMRGDQFYGSNNLEKYPNGKLNICKKDITMHVDNWNPDTYLWILQECDVPYVHDEWLKLMESYGQDSSKLTGMTILGRYLSKMKLNQYNKYRWKDNDFLQEKANSAIEQAMKRQGYAAAEIEKAKSKGAIIIPEGELKEPEYADPPVNPDLKWEDDGEDYFAKQSGAEDDFVDDLTEEERKMLRIKWGKMYKPEEWIKLEQLYREMMDSYDIQGAAQIDNLKLICKTSLKANQLIDIGDIEGYQKMSKVYDSLMKSGRFTAAQIKTESGEFLDSISEFVAVCERDGFIPVYYTDGPQDKVDKTILDLENYTKDLVENETNLNQLLEGAIHQIMVDKEAEAREEDELDDDDDDALFQDIPELKTEDFQEFNDFEDELDEENIKLFNKLANGGTE